MFKYAIGVFIIMFIFLSIGFKSNNTITILENKYNVSFTNVDYSIREVITDTLNNIEEDDTYLIWEETIVNLVKDNKASLIPYIIDIGLKTKSKQVTAFELLELINIMKQYSNHANVMINLDT